MYKYIQLANFLWEKINRDEYKAGEKLPSVRKMAKEWSVNTDTVIRAYEKLEEEHLVYSASKSGFFVVKSPLEDTKKDGSIDLVTVRPPDKHNPYKDINHCMEQAGAVYGRRLYDYAFPQGLKELSEMVSSYLMESQIFARPEDIFITSGAQQALYILAVMDFPGRGGKILVEQPTYSMLLQIVKNNRLPVLGINRTEEGIDLRELERIFQKEDIKFFYLMPRYQNPTGFSYTQKQKKAIAKLAEKYQVYLVEDDYVADLETDSKADSVFSMGDRNHIIYIRSFSKTLLPGLRLGMVILPEKLQEIFIRVKQSMDLNTTLLTQGALEIYLKSGMYKHHIGQIRSYYKEKMDCFKRACEENLSGIAEWSAPDTGIYAIIRVKDKRERPLVKMLSEYGIFLKCTKDCYLPDVSHDFSIRLCVCNVSDDELLRVIKDIKRFLDGNTK